MNPLADGPPVQSANIFINYRRDDSAGHAGRLFDGLSNHFPGRLFMDVDTIAPGIDFVEAIEQAVGACKVLIVVIGREWLTLKNAAGSRRIDDSADFVRLEVETALARNIRIIPVLVEDAPPPRPEDLPPSLARLARRNAIELSDARWGYDVDRLAHTIQGVLRAETSAPPPEAPRKPPTASAEGRPAGSRAWPRTLTFLLAAVLLVSAGWISKNQFQSATGETTGSRVGPAPVLALSSLTPSPADAGPTSAPARSNPAPVPAPASPPLPKPYAGIRPVEPEPSRTGFDGEKAPDETLPLPGVTITSPRDGDKAGKCVTVKGIVSELGAGQRAFLCMKNREGTIYPRGELLPGADGRWSMEATSSHHDFEIFVVIATSPEAGEALNDPGTQEHGLRLLPKGAPIMGPVVSVKRQGKVIGWINSKCGRNGR
jgi:TIR domain-containing protein